MQECVKIIICDDNIAFLDEFKFAVAKTFSEMGVETDIASYTDSQDMIDAMENGIISADAVFLDIQMPGQSGFEAAELIYNIDENIKVIFISEMEQLVYESFRYKPFWFLRKSDISELYIVTEKLIKYLESLSKTYKIIMKGEELTIAVNDIVYFEVNKHDIKVHTTENHYTYRGSLTKAESRLKGEFFARCHEGFLVNCRHIKKLMSNAIIVSTGSRIPVSRRKLKEVRSEYAKYLRRV